MCSAAGAGGAHSRQGQWGTHLPPREGRLHDRHTKSRAHRPLPLAASCLPLPPPLKAPLRLSRQRPSVSSHSPRARARCGGSCCAPLTHHPGTHPMPTRRRLPIPARPPQARRHVGDGHAIQVGGMTDLLNAAPMSGAYAWPCCAMHTSSLRTEQRTSRTPRQSVVAGTYQDVNARITYLIGHPQRSHVKSLRLDRAAGGSQLGHPWRPRRCTGGGGEQVWPRQ